MRRMRRKKDLGKRSTPCPRREASMNQKLFIRVNDCAPSFGSMFAYILRKY